MISGYQKKWDNLTNNAFALSQKICPLFYFAFNPKYTKLFIGTIILENMYHELLDIILCSR